MERYHRQMRFQHFGESGQRQLQQLHVFVIGVGALGSGIAEQLVRSGVGKLTIVDKDVVHLSNLHRQSGYVEADAEAMKPKVFALKERLAMMNHEVTIEPLYEEVTARNIEGILEALQPDMVLDGLDRFETRYLVNEATRKLNIPYIYGAVVGSQLSVFPVSHDGPCLHCVMPDVPETMESCDLNGVLPPAVHLASSFVVAEVFYYLMHGDFSYQMTTSDIDQGKVKKLSIQNLKEADCPVCAQRQFTRLQNKQLETTQLLCGGVYQFRLAPEQFEAPICQEVAILIDNAFVKRFRLESFEMTFYQDGRLLVYGAEDIHSARSIVRQLFEYPISV
ncbi:ThiF family adenylyltransferase [Staphylococcus intermedius]|uniref:HesA/MoeB/ThiF family protein n=1 Tax=Staphylococcus intermedius NCTC 11048 TaxID=1141106 RepID=A0A380GBA6_STAIN|nr:ThiF family adenylyltransferase [Staphylococcus intermedius]PCF65523.1 dinucleotide-utilizing protein [Staphylococcus intermedius]PCF81201.1 dinucleotide-utilizing protein [Staphylococcus intermedius]PCF82484.1 dinucleotide-utilizing protein [Staphylococcus intermedius]PCF87183.1 dinucleotide-utilizing protein [Staphylococcus intermedius]PCF87743.1 dinucleotide-utilizing protein [Staphylococcus intermedius]